jgi:Domain of unknown function (DUF4281)
MKLLDMCYRIMSMLSLSAWALLIALPAWQHTLPAVLYLIVPLLCVMYVYLLFFARPAGIDKPQGSFFTSRGVIALFKNPRAVMAGWTHFLVFDLMVALWIRGDAPLHGIGHAWLIPVYLLTLMFGPLGLLAYFVLRLILGA